MDELPLWVGSSYQGLVYNAHQAVYVRFVRFF